MFYQILLHTKAKENGDSKVATHWAARWMCSCTFHIIIFWWKIDYSNVKILLLKRYSRKSLFHRQVLMQTTVSNMHFSSHSVCQSVKKFINTVYVQYTIFESNLSHGTQQTAHRTEIQNCLSNKRNKLSTWMLMI